MNAENYNQQNTATDLQKTIMQVPANQTDTSSTNFQTTLANGGGAILAIFALTFFTKTLIESIAKLLKVWNKKK
jgi:hypothetical protein